MHRKIIPVIECLKGPLDVCNCSFPACYGAEFSPIPDAMDGGVPLEHLISCVPGIQIQVSSSGVKKIQWAENKPPSQIGVYFMFILINAFTVTIMH